MNKLNGAVLIIGLMVMTGCTSLPEVTEGSQAKTMKEIMRQSKSSVEFKINRYIAEQDNIDLAGFTRTAANETEVLFPELPNPTLSGFIYHHLGTDGTPVPGYSIPFKMTEKTYYALPGESGVRN